LPSASDVAAAVAFASAGTAGTAASAASDTNRKKKSAYTMRSIRSHFRQRPIRSVTAQTVTTTTGVVDGDTSLADNDDSKPVVEGLEGPERKEVSSTTFIDEDGLYRRHYLYYNIIIPRIIL